MALNLPNDLEFAHEKRFRRAHLYIWFSHGRVKLSFTVSHTYYFLHFELEKLLICDSCDVDLNCNSYIREIIVQLQYFFKTCNF